MNLIWHKYKYFPYEKELAVREVMSLLRPSSINATGKTVFVDQPKNENLAKRLVYFSSVFMSDKNSMQTQQAILEKINGNGANRQSTRYSSHGLHEYKGKFNPQTAKAILNIFNAQPGQIALDPFCGSGTSLIECSHMGIKSVGTDINPLAVYLANAKLQSLGIPAKDLRKNAIKALQKAKNTKEKTKLFGERGEYLLSWFQKNYLEKIENLRIAIESLNCSSVPVLLALASNLLRDYSLQEPSDLRIRRRLSEYPKVSFFDAYEFSVNNYCDKIEAAQEILGVRVSDSIAINIDCKNALKHPDIFPEKFDLVLTSPPYATALPYIDTQRLSLVWLGLISPKEIASLEAELVGSREIRGESKKALLNSLEKNNSNLPEIEANFCLELQAALAEADGFRRRLTPSLLYRYFSGMADAFSTVKKLVKADSPFGLIVGGNHTVLGGKRFEINTPEHLASIARSRGWKHIETIPLQTYKRYGLHANNATSTEALLILRAS